MRVCETARRNEASEGSGDLDPVCAEREAISCRGELLATNQGGECFDISLRDDGVVEVFEGAALLAGTGVAAGGGVGEP
jgi:hypothetical protein